MSVGDVQPSERTRPLARASHRRSAASIRSANLRPTSRSRITVALTHRGRNVLTVGRRQSGPSRRTFSGSPPLRQDSPLRYDPLTRAGGLDGASVEPAEGICMMALAIDRPGTLRG